MNIMITGGLGYIGSHLISNLIGNWNIIVVDNLYTQKYNVLINRSCEFKFIEKDILNITYADLKSIDMVIHLAAIVDATKSKENKNIIEETNINNTMKLFYKCADLDIPFIFPSSTSVYGTSKKIVIEDDNSVLNPQSYYAEAKIEVERKIKDTNAKHLILRLGTVCGFSRGIRFHTVINKFCFQAVFGQPLTIWKSNIYMVRPYLCLSDVSKSLNFLIEKKIFNQTFNVLTQNLSTNSIIDMIQRNISIKKEYTDCPLLNQNSYEVSTKKIETFGFEASGNVENDIKKTINMLL